MASLVAHRHCQVAFDNFFCGNYPGSKRCIAPHVGLPTILLQALMPMGLRIIVTSRPTGVRLNLYKRDWAVMT